MSSLRCCKRWPDASIRQMWLIGTRHQKRHAANSTTYTVAGQRGHNCIRPLSSSGISWRGVKASRHRTGGFGTSRRYTTSSVLWIIVIDAARIVRGTGSVQQSGVRLSVPLIDSSNGGQQVCCWVPCWQEYRSIASGPLWASFCGRH